jgi:hypothetical protein
MKNIIIKHLKTIGVIIGYVLVLKVLYYLLIVNPEATVLGAFTIGAMFVYGMVYWAVNSNNKKKL